MIICRHCQTEQAAGRFCTDCGQPLEQKNERTQSEQLQKQELNEQKQQQQEKQENQEKEQELEKQEPEQENKQEQGNPLTASAEPINATESAGDQEADSFVALEKPPVRAGFSWSFATILRMAATPLVGYVISLLVSIGFGIWFQQSKWLRDWIYRLHTEYWGWSAAEASAATNSFATSWWHVLVQMHAGETKFIWRSVQDAALELQYTLQLPLIGLVILGAVILVISQKLLGRILGNWRNEKGVLSRSIAIIGSSILYGLLIMLTLLLFHPAEKWELPSVLAGLSMAETVSAFGILWRASLIYAAAALLANLSWRTRKSTANELNRESGPSQITVMWTSGLRLLVKWIALVTVIVVVIGLLIPVVWSVSDPLSFYEQPPSSIVHQWQAYSDDPVLWGALPTIWIQEWLFAMGGQLRLEGNMLAELLRLETMRLHLVTGVTLDKETLGEPSSVPQGLAKAARTNWHVWSMLVLTLYGTARLARRSTWLELAVFAIGAGGFGALAAYLTALTVGVLDITEIQRLGHSPGYAAIQLALVGFAAGAAGKLWSSQIDRLRRMNGVRTDGDK